MTKVSYRILQDITPNEHANYIDPLPGDRCPMCGNSGHPRKDADDVIEVHCYSFKLSVVMLKVSHIRKVIFLIL